MTELDWWFTDSDQLSKPMVKEANPGGARVWRSCTKDLFNRRTKMPEDVKKDAVYTAVENAGRRSVYQVFCKFICVWTCIRISKKQGPLGVLNFIEIHSKIYKKLSLSRNHNPYLVIPKYCKFVHLKNSSVIQENWREEDCLNQRYTLV